MADLTGRVCDYCGAPLREIVNGACPFCKTPVPAAVLQSVATGAPGAPNTLVDVVLLDPGRNKIGVIKVVREQTGSGLREAKDAVEAPQSRLATGLSPADGRAWLQVLTEAGATAELRPSGT